MQHEPFRQILFVLLAVMSPIGVYHRLKSQSSGEIYALYLPTGGSATVRPAPNASLSTGSTERSERLA